MEGMEASKCPLPRRVPGAVQVKVCLVWLRSRLQLSHNVLREVCTYIDDSSLVVDVSESQLRLFDRDLSAWEKPVSYSSKITCDGNTRYIGIGQRKVFVCGYTTANEEAHKAYMLDIWTNSVHTTQLASLRERRSMPGLAFDQGEVFVFGGYGQPDLRTGESLVLKAGCEWNVLSGTMSEGKQSFTPVQWRHQLLLPGGYHSKTVEVFDFTSRQFLLPFNWRLEATGYVVSWIHSEQLTVVQENSTTIADLVTGTVSTATHKFLGMETSSPPVKGNNGVYCVCRGRCFKLSVAEESTTVTILTA